MAVKRIPHPPRRIPLIGDVLGMDRRRPNQRTLWQFDRLGPIYRRTILGNHLTFVGSNAMAQEVCDERHWQRYMGRPIAQLKPVAREGLFTAENDSEAWQTGHEVLAAGFTQDAMRRYHPTMQAVATQLCAFLTAQPHQPRLEEVLSRTALKVITECGFGYSQIALDGETQFTEALRRGLAYTQESAVPVIGALTGKRKQFQQDVQMLRDTVSDVVRGRQPGDGYSDLLQLMLDSGRLTASEIEDQVLTFLVAGHETTGNLLAFAMFYLARRPDLVEAIAEEWRESDGSWNAAAKMRMTRAVISESLRLWPTAPGFFRQARHDTTLGGYAIAEGEWVFLLLLAVHRDSQVWESPEEFRPERFLGKQPSGAMFKPFGTGPRACIGRAFALHEATIVLSEICGRFTLSADDSRSAPEVDENLTLRPQVDVTFSPR